MFLFKPQILSTGMSTSTNHRQEAEQRYKFPSKTLGISREFHYKASHNNTKHGLISGLVNTWTKYLLAYGLS